MSNGNMKNILKFVVAFGWEHAGAADWLSVGGDAPNVVALKPPSILLDARSSERLIFASFFGVRAVRGQFALTPEQSKASASVDLREVEEFAVDVILAL